jgi:hypothetical protein
LGLGRLFRDQAAAETWLGQRAHPAPMGNVTKPRGMARLNTVSSRT